MNKYPYNAERYLNEARGCLSRMRNSKTVSDVKEAFISFLNSSRFIFQSWNKDFKDLEGFEEWWKERSKYLENDPLCKFFRDLRNRVIKEGVNPFWVNQSIRGPLTISGPVQIGPEGILKGMVENGRQKWTAVALEGVETVIGFNDGPAGYEKFNPFEICEEYLSILSEITDEFVRKFG